MMKTLFLVASLFTVVVSAIAQTSGAVMTFEKEKHDFGDVQEGEEISHDFEFTNTGDKNLVIIDVVGSCSCTASSWPKEPVLPGEKAVITATFDTKDKSGAFNKSLTITTNAVEETKRLYIKGNVLGSGGTSQNGEE